MWSGIICVWCVFTFAPVKKLAVLSVCWMFFCDHGLAELSKDCFVNWHTHTPATIHTTHAQHTYWVFVDPETSPYTHKLHVAVTLMCVAWCCWGWFGRYGFSFFPIRVRASRDLRSRDYLWWVHGIVTWVIAARTINLCINWWMGRLAYWRWVNSDEPSWHLMVITIRLRSVFWVCFVTVLFSTRYVFVDPSRISVWRKCACECCTSPAQTIHRKGGTNDFV
jgi:hypothetical protein